MVNRSYRISESASENEKNDLEEDPRRKREISKKAKRIPTSCILKPIGAPI